MGKSLITVCVGGGRCSRWGNPIKSNADFGDNLGVQFSFFSHKYYRRGNRDRERERDS